MTETIQFPGTADLCDFHSDAIQVVKTPLKQFGGRSRCSGPVVTFQLDEDNRVLKDALQTPGEGRVAVVDVSGEICSKGKMNVTLHFGGVSFEPEAYLYADEDGIVVSDKKRGL